MLGSGNSQQQESQTELETDPNWKMAVKMTYITLR